MSNGKTKAITITLDFPIKVDGVEISTISIRRPKVNDILVAEKSSNGSSTDSEIQTFANLCQLTPADIRELDFGDYKKLQQAFTGFFS